ncbi:hypothetical protein BDW71DRAFT_177598 [Aspergillus fruticulosus]
MLQCYSATHSPVPVQPGYSSQALISQRRRIPRRTPLATKQRKYLISGPALADVYRVPKLGT